jgi:hypothetical protein
VQCPGGHPNALTPALDLVARVVGSTQAALGERELGQLA